MGSLGDGTITGARTRHHGGDGNTGPPTGIAYIPNTSDSRVSCARRPTVSALCRISGVPRYYVGTYYAGNR